jgi:hypothetical protein
MEETEAKSNALYVYIKKQADKNLKGGIVKSTQAGLYVFEGEKYDSNISSKGWERLEI